MILYRGPLSSCNYSCSYCPFAKHKENQDSLNHDKATLSRFVNWVAKQTDDRISILFTPWGEALIRRWYQQAIIELSLMAQVDKVAIQTNLSCHLDWVEDCQKNKVALWTTFHPTQVKRERFLAQCYELEQRNLRYSVGIVGLKEFQNEIAFLRRALKPQVYLWINAYKEIPHYYTLVELDYFNSIDPLFHYNIIQIESKGRYCHAGQTVVAIDGEGNIRRCFFIKQSLGNIYQGDLKKVLKPRTCPNQYCDCHIGYVHLNDLELDEIFGEGILERIPMQFLIAN